MIDNLLGGGDDEDPDEEVTDSDMDGGLFDGAEDGGDDLVGGGDDLMGGSDEMAFDEMDDGGSATSAEMDNRIDELENEVASLSSTVSTVKSENELISESVEDVEENIRKLLEVYEMVTRGVNPFVDESEVGDAFGGEGGSGGGGSMGLFGDDETGEPEQSEVDDSIADADANEFFDEDIDDESSDDGFGDFDDEFSDEADRDDDSLDDKFDDDDLGGEFSDGDEFEEDDEIDDVDESDDGGGKSFEELKAEYESGDADWDGDEDESSDDDHSDEGTIDEFVETDESNGNEEDGIVASESAAEADIETDNSVTDAETGSETKAPVAGGKPYLERLPPEYVSEIIVMDWLEFLVEEVGIDGASRTIAYYEAIEWIDEPAAETLLTFLNGFGENVEADPEPRSSLTVTHHNASLRFINRIVNPDLEMVSFSGEATSGRRSPRGETHDTNREGDPLRPNSRLKEVRFRGGYGDEPSGERREIESDGGRELPERAPRDRNRTAETESTEEQSEGFIWGDERAE